MYINKKITHQISYKENYNKSICVTYKKKLTIDEFDIKFEVEGKNNVVQKEIIDLKTIK